jgi:hypothetical protein
MARKRKTTRRKTTSRRRRMSGVGKLNAGSILQTIGGIAAGTLAAGLISKKLLGSQNELIQTLVPVALGIATPMFMKSELGKMAGAGMVAYGTTKFLAKYSLAGVGADYIDLPVAVSGDDLSVIAGDDDFAMAGDDDYAMAGDDNLSVIAGYDDMDY